MIENFLHYIWKKRLYKTGSHQTVNGEPLDIIDPGTENIDAGPDFFNAKVKIGNTTWAGNIEIHKKASDWFKHYHHKNEDFNNVILHVVCEYDTRVFNYNNIEIPAWIIPYDITDMYNHQKLFKEQLWLPCSNKIDTIEPIIIDQWLEIMLKEKLAAKSSKIKLLLEKTINDWNEVFYILLVRNFGFGLNSEPFEQLARKTPWRVVAKNSDNLIRLEALFLGQAGFLNKITPDDKYTDKLLAEYNYLSKKYALTPLKKHHWKFLRLRPSNFPTVRLVQMASLFYKQRVNLTQVISKKSSNELLSLLESSPKGYWEDHYIPDILASQKEKNLGKTSRKLIIINTLIPITYAYGELRALHDLKKKALTWLKELPCEENSIITKWKSLGLNPQNAADSQALIYLRQKYCKTKQCYKCKIGQMVISKFPV
ncbi:DUF2851 family protein [Marinilabiliaceae bacterium ANBcel2]|nr:DUF2851 family protein [Marinilabiliaceae bacterium ANBcel2]